MSNQQMGLFDADPVGTAAPSIPRVRAKLEGYLNEARNAPRWPWPPGRREGMPILFRQMSTWLPEAEREAIRAEFAREYSRLQAVG